MSEKELEEKMMENLDDPEMLELFQTLDEELSEVVVSEELIQKTLTAAGLSEKKKRKKKRGTWIYTMAAAAAVVLIYFGSSVGRKAMDNASKSEESTGAACNSPASEAGNTSTGMWYGDVKEETEVKTQDKGDGQGDNINDSMSASEENVTESSREENTASDSETSIKVEDSEPDIAEMEPGDKDVSGMKKLQEALALCGYSEDVTSAQSEAVIASREGLCRRIFGELADGSMVEYLLYEGKQVEICITEADGTKMVQRLDSQKAEQVWECLME